MEKSCRRTPTPDFQRTQRKLFVLYIADGTKLSKKFIQIMGGGKATYEDVETTDVFDPKAVTQMSEGELKNRLVKYKVALQPNKHPEIWRKLCATLCDDFDGDIRNLFIKNDNSVEKIKEYIVGNKKKFPYLSGPKILNYWLYVMTQ